VSKVLGGHDVSNMCLQALGKACAIHVLSSLPKLLSTTVFEEQVTTRPRTRPSFKLSFSLVILACFVEEGQGDPKVKEDKEETKLANYQVH
jgi:hypothetical protein